MKIRKKQYWVSTSEVLGLYGFLIFLPVVFQHPSGMPIYIYLKIILSNPINWLVFIFTTWVAIKYFVHEYTTEDLNQIDQTKKT